ncbi:CPBP family intramembrane metalloprotease [Gelidibacter japonicus]|uniref:CPBP family intramembrane glutamic endopeptidase n=1 Tax=Gelidibacter japonicus TaxID=1962232 RepID=UPI0020215AD9|nr:type II CAAX endopeptidase family protein [Gelidibacter japonicus]MCL8009548.1 CPBP family intramembrane metalloprotease [Gelidibacter japonicus]
MTRKLYLFLILFTSILLVGFYFTSILNNFWIAHFTHLGIMFIAGLTLIGLEKGKFPYKEKQSFEINQVIGIVIGIIGLIGVSNLIPVLGSKITGIQMSGFYKTAELNRILLVVISLSIFEEILFRRILAQKIKNTLGFKKAIWISALIFSIVHIYTDTGLLSAFIAGAILAYIYLKTNNIYLSIIAHLFYNLTTYFFTPLFIENFDRINNHTILISTILIGLGLMYGMISILNKKPAGNNV